MRVPDKPGTSLTGRGRKDQLGREHLRTQASDVAELAALAQRLLDSQPPERWCVLESLDDIQ